MIQTYLHINADGYVEGTSLGGIPRTTLPGCTLVEDASAIPEKPAGTGEEYRFHRARQQWEDIRSLATFKLDHWEQIKAERTAREYGTYTAPTGQVIDISQASQIRIQSSYNLAVDAKAAGTAFSVEWTLIDNSTLMLNANQMIALGKGVMNYVSGLYVTARTLRNQILAAATIDEVKAVVWPV